MRIVYKIDHPKEFSEEEKNDFLKLLIKQDQVDNPSLKKINDSQSICIAYIDKIAIGIGALKQVYKSPFEYAGVKEFKDSFDLEIGYLFVDNDPKDNHRGLGIGKSITRLLVNNVPHKSIFATTELNNHNPMIHILKSLGFESIGKPFKGKKTGKIITLMILNRGDS